jgi:hypothetical protein
MQEQVTDWGCSSGAPFPPFRAQATAFEHNSGKIAVTIHFVGGDSGGDPDAIHGTNTYSFSLADLDPTRVVVQSTSALSGCPRKNGQGWQLQLHTRESARRVSLRLEQQRKIDGKFETEPVKDSIESDVNLVVGEQDLAKRLQKAFVHAINLCSTDRPKDVF